MDPLNAKKTSLQHAVGTTGDETDSGCTEYAAGNEAGALDISSHIGEGYIWPNYQKLVWYTRPSRVISLPTNTENLLFIHHNLPLINFDYS